MASNKKHAKKNMPKKGAVAQHCLYTAETYAVIEEMLEVRDEGSGVTVVNSSAVGESSEHLQ